MKNILILLLAGLCSLTATAQTASDQADLLKGWENAWNGYKQGNEAAMWAAYADNACEVYPDGSSICGLANIKAGYAQFSGMLESQPSWSYSTPEVHFIDANNAIMFSDIVSDMKLKGGQQIGGKTKFVAVMHKQNGKWQIVLDTQTPVMQMPETGK